MDARSATWSLTKFVLRLASLVVVVALVGGLVAAVGVAVAPHGQSLITAVEGERESEVLPLVQGAERSKMYDSYGGLMAILRDAEDREWIPLDRMPETVINGVLKIEDEDFYEHNGVDWLATVRAASENVAAGGVTQGASTLTQQLVKLQFVGADQTLERKIREAMLAMDLEEQYTKDEILEYYLNTIYFGNSAYGVQAAAEIYFGKNAEDLDYGDMALLSGVIRSPGVFTFSDPDIDFARLRRSRSLERYIDTGLITEAEAAEIEERPIPTFSRSPQEEELQLDYFAEEVKRRLLEMPELGETREARRQAVFQGGLRIYTTFDPVLDRYAQEAVEEVFPDRSVLDPFTVSLASVDPSTGAVRAMLGGTDFTEEQFNLATQGRRQPGSSFKSYVLTTAFEQGYGPNDTISGLGPCIFDDGSATPYQVQNFGNGGGSIGSLQQMTTSSSNCAFVRLGLLVGLEEVVQTTTDMVGLEEGRLLPFPSMSLGAQELTPLEQAIGYSVLANDGMRMEPFLITRIEDRNGQVLFEHVPTGRQVVSEGSARNVTRVLAANVTGGTGTRARLASGQPAAGKTGTAQDFEDAWFAGYTPQLSTAVWMGHPEEKVSMRGVGGRNVTGGSYPAQVWNAFMSRALADEPIVEFESGPGQGRNEFLFLPDEKCSVRIQVGEEILSFSIACSLVDFVDGGFAFGETAICRNQEIPLPDGTTEIRDVPCNELERLLNPTTTTSSSTTTEPTTTTEPVTTTTTRRTTTTEPAPTTTPPTTTEPVTTTTEVTTTTTEPPPTTTEPAPTTTEDPGGGGGGGGGGGDDADGGDGGAGAPSTTEGT